jgi:acyl-CoA oxidase
MASEKNPFDAVRAKSSIN